MQVKRVKLKLKNGDVVEFENAIIDSADGNNVVRFDGGAFSVSEENTIWVRVWF